MSKLKLNLMSPFIMSALLVVSGAACSAASDDIDQEYNVGAGGTLTIESDSGRIEVNTWDQNRVRLRIRNTEGFEVDIAQSGDNVRVLAESERRGLFGFRRSSISFVADVPDSYNLNLNTGGGAIQVANINGSIDADTSGGSIEVGDVTGGNVRADTSGGRIEIGDVDGSVEADTSGGSITIGDVTGEVSADTSGGNINIGNVDGDLTADTSGGNITVGESGGRVELDTSGGTIRAAWALGPIVADTSGGNIILEGSNTSVRADTSGGNITVERSNGPVDADTSGGSITIRQAVGPIRADTAGGRIDAELASASGSRDATVELETAGGDVTIRIPSNHNASVSANLEVTRRSRGDYRIYTDFPLSIQESDNGNIVGSGDINGGGDRIYLETTNSDIHIVSVDN
ncbi:MAG: hypothetical protein O2971_11220 [Proteobacteria bacterium]|nr:hypothetical protein [Pseudomonadota bacterium]